MKKALATIGAAALMVTGLAATPASAAPVTYDLIAKGGSVATSNDIGDVVVDNNGTTVEIDITVDGELDATNAVETRIYDVFINTGCDATGYPLTKGNPVIGKYEYKNYIPGGARSWSGSVPSPVCAAGVPTVSVHTNAKELGNWAGLNDVVKSGVTTAQFKVALDTGSDPAASYFDTTFITGPFAGQTFDGYCVDIGNTIGTGTIYTGTMVTLDQLVNDGNIDKPEYLPSVMWLLNNYKPGQTITVVRPDLTTYQYVLTSGTIQRAIWYLVDLTQSTSGLGAFDDLAAKQIAAEARLNNVLPTSLGCNQLIPIVLVIGGQTTIGQTTLVNVEIPCEDITSTAMAMDTSVEVQEGTSLRYGLQFPGDNWFSYVKAPVVVEEPAV